MKLAFVLFRYFPFGGLQRDFLRIAEACLQRGHAVHVFTMAWEAPPHPALPVTLVPVKGLQNHTRIRAFIKALPAMLAGQSFDRIVGFNKMPGLDVYFAADSCFQAGVRATHGAWYRLLPRYRTFSACEKAVFEKTNHTRILLLCDRQREEFTHFYGTSPERFHLLPPGIARDRLVPSLPAPKTSAHRHILFVGSGFRTKGLDRAITALAALPPALRDHTRMSVIGSGDTSTFVRQVRRLGLENQIDFQGGRSDVPDFLREADLLIHPARRENTGTVLLEALASALPVLTTDVCGYARLIIEAGAGMVLASPFQQTELNKALQHMLTAETQQTWRQGAFNFAHRADIYSLPQEAARHIEAPLL